VKVRSVIHHASEHHDTYTTVARHAAGLLIVEAARKGPRH